MIKNIIIAVLLLFIFSCKEKKDDCKSIQEIRFPEDISRMINIKQVCDISSNKWENILKLEYDDDNYSLLGYNEKIKILIDKRNKLIMCIKSNEANNFKVLYNKKDDFTYGINEIVFLDENLMPIYSIGNYGLYKYFNDPNNQQTKYCLIDNEKIYFNDITYSQILNIYRMMIHKKIDEKKCQISPYYKSPYSWEL